MPILVVIDASDECEKDDAEIILSLLAQEVPQIPHLRVFITARPEQHIRSVFEQDHNHDQFHLHYGNAANFILDREQVDPAGQSAVLLKGVTDMASLGSEPMDKVYMGIIRAAQPRRGPVGQWIDRFQICAGTIVLLYDPLPCDALAASMGIDIDDIVRTLSNLHSLFAPSSNGPSEYITNHSLISYATPIVPKEPHSSRLTKRRTICELRNAACMSWTVS